jgi:hypothetical protein
METEKISETLVFNSKLKRLIAQEGISTFIRRESFKSFIFLESSTQTRTAICFLNFHRQVEKPTLP